MIKAICFDAGGVLFLNENGYAVVNKSIISFIEANKDKYILGVLSSTKLPLRDILSSYKLDKYFQYIQTAGEYGMTKDHSEFFSEAIRKLGIKSDEAILIDNDVDFLKAADAAGLRTISYQPDIDIEAAFAKVI